MIFRQRVSDGIPYALKVPDGGKGLGVNQRVRWALEEWASIQVAVRSVR